MKGAHRDPTGTLEKSRRSKDKPKSNATTCAAGPPTNEQIAALAYCIWEQEGRPEGRDLEHWRTAEAQLRQTRVPSGPPGK